MNVLISRVLKNEWASEHPGHTWEIWEDRIHTLLADVTVNRGNSHVLLSHPDTGRMTFGWNHAFLSAWYHLPLLHLHISGRKSG